MFKKNPSEGNYSRLDQHDEEDEDYFVEHAFQHPNSVLVSNHHCNIVPDITIEEQHLTPKSNPSRPSFSATRHFFQTKLPNVFSKDDDIPAASFSSLPAIIIADLQKGNVPVKTTIDMDDTNDQGWSIIRRKRFKGKHGIGESRHPQEVIMDEELDPSDQVTCSVFIQWVSEEPQYTMSSRYHTPIEERKFSDPIPETPERFKEIIESVQIAIENNMQPTRISQGSSGSYFCRNSSGKIVGVFKPKNEEPYGRLNPKWTKWIHRHLFPCFFGRSCLIPNLGYLSEAGASLIDRRLGTFIVPYTDVIHLTSPSFHYDYLDRRAPRLPPKMGSFQCFLTDYKDATVFFRNHPLMMHLDENRQNSSRSVWTGACLGRSDRDYQEDEDEDSDHTHVNSASLSFSTVRSKKQESFRWTAELQQQFRREFEQLVILDYLIRNTDRGLDNWMIKYCDGDKKTCRSSSSSSSLEEEERVNQKKKGHIHVAAIDNGLAFPYKHPDQWRSYPYGWMAMPDALVNSPFSEASRHQFLKVLSDPLWWRETVRELRKLCELDDDFDEKMFQKQISVLKGQGYNIVKTLKNPSSGPIDLVAMPRIIIHQEEVVIEYDERLIQARMVGQQQIQKPVARLRPQRSTSFDVISTTSSPFYDEEEENELGSEDRRFSNPWANKIKSGLSIDLHRGGLFKKKKAKKNRYRAFDSDGDLSDNSDHEEEPKVKRVTIIMETIELVKSRTYFTCW